MRKGEHAPDFELVDQSGALRSLGSLLAEGPVVLFFYPGAMTPICTAEACHFRDLGAELAEVGAHAVGISADAVAKQRQWDDKHDFGYPLLSDPDGTVAKRYGVDRPTSLLPNKRATFVIAADGTVLDVVRSEVRPHVHADRAVAALRAAPR